MNQEMSLKIFHDRPVWSEGNKCITGNINKCTETEEQTEIEDMLNYSNIICLAFTRKSVVQFAVYMIHHPLTSINSHRMHAAQH